ncbi:hypothetical protein ACU4GD_30415 [Cupriavidus basilensis]
MSASLTTSRPVQGHMPAYIEPQTVFAVEMLGEALKTVKPEGGKLNTSTLARALENARHQDPRWRDEHARRRSPGAAADGGVRRRQGREVQGRRHRAWVSSRSRRSPPPKPPRRPRPAARCRAPSDSPCHCHSKTCQLSAARRGAGKRGRSLRRPRAIWPHRLVPRKPSWNTSSSHCLTAPSTACCCSWCRQA